MKFFTFTEAWSDQNPAFLLYFNLMFWSDVFIEISSENAYFKVMQRLNFIPYVNWFVTH